MSVLFQRLVAEVLSRQSNNRSTGRPGGTGALAIPHLTMRASGLIEHGKLTPL